MKTVQEILEKIKESIACYSDEASNPINVEGLRYGYVGAVTALQLLETFIQEPSGQKASVAGAGQVSQDGESK